MIQRPPRDPAELVDFPSKSIPADYPYVRIHHQQYEPEWFDTGPLGRFNAPIVAEFGTCYLSGHPLGAFVEKFGRLKMVTRDLVDKHLVAQLQVTSPVRVADLTDRSIVGRWNLTSGIWAGGDYEGCQAWAHRLHQAGFAGIWYPAAHDTRGDLHSLALFGKPGYQPNDLLCINDLPLSDWFIDDAVERFGISVMPSPTF